MAEVSKAAVGEYLLQHGFFLTALEFHQELLEEDQGLPLLQHFFSKDPPDFQKTDTARYFDLNGAKTSLGLKDDHREAQHANPVNRSRSHENLAATSEEIEKKNQEIELLRYELRRSKETITNMRQELTQMVEREHNQGPASAPKPEDVEVKKALSVEDLKPYEKRLLNWLVNQYLVSSGYKLTAITLCDEETEQDLDVWDDVGINGLPPPPLLLFLRYFYNAGPNQHLRDTEVDLRKTRKQLEKLQGQIQSMMWTQEQSQGNKSEIQQLKDEIFILQEENQRLKTTGVPSSSSNKQPRSVNSSRDPVSSHANGSQSKGPDANSKEAAKEKSANVVADKDEDDSSAVPESSETKKAVRKAKRFEFSFPKQDSVPQNSRVAALVLRMSEGVERGKASKELTPVEIVGECLPHLIEGVLLKKRDELLPILLTTIRHHPDANVRHELTRVLFNLIKKPDLDYRNMIMAGCVSLARLIGPMRVDCELLQICWEQIGHQLEERRVLVAESCGSLARYASASMRRSLLLSILNDQIIDKVPMVRAAVAKNLALLLPWIPPDAASDKWSQIEQMFLRLFYDASEEVQESVRNSLISIFAQWSVHVDRMRSHFVPMLFGEVQKLLKNIDPTRLHQQDCIRVDKVFDILSFLLPMIWDEVVSKSPFDEGPPAQALSSSSAKAFPSKSSTSVSSSSKMIAAAVAEQTAADDEEQLFELRQIYGSDREQVMDKQQIDNLTGQINSFLSNYHVLAPQTTPWKELEWTIKDFVEKLLHLIVVMDSMTSTRVVNTIARFLRALCNCFGSAYARSIVHALFLFELEKETHLSNPREIQLKRTRLAPVFIVGVLPALEDSDLEQFLRDLVTNIALEECGWSLTQLPMLKDCVKLLCSQKQHDDSNPADITLTSMKTVTVNLLCRELLMHPSAAVRVVVVHLFNVMVDILSGSELEKRLLPALITLSGDSDLTIKTSCIRPLGTFCTMVKRDDILEKISIQFDNILEGAPHTVVLEIIRVLGDIIQNVRPTFRDGCILPKLTRITEKNSQSRNEQQKQDVARQLFQAYKALAGCTISQDTTSMYIVPSLRTLNQVAQTMGDPFKTSVAQMLREMESVVGRVDPTQSLPDQGLGSSLLTRFRTLTERPN